jgi:chorismate-pyruvate lyase
MSVHTEHAAFFRLPATIATEEDRSKHAVWRSLGSHTKALLSTDGTLTQLLDAFSGESVETVLLAQAAERADAVSGRAMMSLDPHEPVTRREVLLRTARSKRNLVYAESRIADARLPPGLHASLMQGTRPIGLLLRSARIESFRELLDWGIHPLDDAPCPSACFDAPELVYRSYHIVVASRPMMRITEYFPRTLFEGGDE